MCSQHFCLTELFNGEVYIYHTINCVLLLGIILISDYFIGNSLLREEVSTFDPWLEYGWFTTLLYFCRCLPLLGLPQAVFNFLGLIFFQSFPQSPQLNVRKYCYISISSHFMPNFIQFRNPFVPLPESVFVLLPEETTLNW